VFENRVLRRIFGPKVDGVTGEWKRLRNEELPDLYSSPNTVRLIKSRIKWAEHLTHMDEGTGEYRILVRKPEIRRSLGTLVLRWDDDIEMDIQEV
jgi:hypothetical protein